MRAPVFCNSLVKELSEYLAAAKYSRIAILVDEHTEQHCLPLIGISEDHFDLIRVKSGEDHKNIQSSIHIWQKLTELNLDRKSLIINLGGGVILDMGGFCASTFKRGIEFINIPTTLLAQVDASIGGKLGIDFNGFKNQVGLFREPDRVFIYPSFLKTLDFRELRSGFAEVIKHTLIRDAGKWAEISTKLLENQNIEELIHHSVSVKSQIVTVDPFEKNERKLLNFGHTIGHGLESLYLSMKEPILHGEAIAVGMILESFISYKHSLLKFEEYNAIKEYIVRIFGKIQLPDAHDFEKLIELIQQDKKNKGFIILGVGLHGIGNGVIDVEYSEKEIKEAFVEYKGI